MTVYSCVVFLSQLEKSMIRDCFFCLLDAAIYNFFLFSQTLPICTGGSSLNLRASLVPAYYRDKFSFCKKSVYDCVSLMVICGPQKFQMAPQKIGRGPNMALKITDLGTTPSLHGRMYYLPKFKAYIKR